MIKTKNPELQSGFLFYKRSGSENMLIVSQRGQRLQLIRKRQELFRELEEISYLPKRQMERRYYSIRPKLMQVSRLLRNL